MVHKHGGPDVLQVEEIPVPIPQSGEVLVNNQAIGVNFVDPQHRAGLNYPVNLPLIPGVEAAGIVESVGSDVAEFKVGDRVGYAGYMGGNYADYTVVPESKIIFVPDNVSFELAAASLLQGMTAHCLSQSVYPIQEGNVILIQAGAGGVGSLLVQMAKARGLRSSLQYLMGYLKKDLPSEDNACLGQVGAPGPHRGLSTGAAATDRAFDATEASVPLSTD
jgi:NADPH2:quinone reductase